MSEDATQTAVNPVDTAVVSTNIAANIGINFTHIGSHIEAMRQLNAFDEITGRKKIGAWDWGFEFYHTMEDSFHRFHETPTVVKNLVQEFKNMPEIKLTRTHGRTTDLERVQMAVYAKAISPNYIARKFNVSLPTVYLYARKYGPLV